MGLDSSEDNGMRGWWPKFGFQERWNLKEEYCEMRAGLGEFAWLGGKE